MSRNIVIFSDGTGQRGGVLVDERRSNIYKLYRAARCGPESSVDPAEQLTFYDPGIGTHPEGRGTLGSLWAAIYNLVSQALGLGLTANIVDCYAALVRLCDRGTASSCSALAGAPTPRAASVAYSACAACRPGSGMGRSCTMRLAQNASRARRW
jgi:Uncharacterized alpha/beta hydrolase domain (DUF2235)